jgi:hypothetical protein
MRQPTVARWIALPLIAGVAWAGGAHAQQIFVYPQRGQSPEQQQRDRFECHQWAVQQSGFDPTAAPVAQAPPPPPSPQGAMGGPSAVRGAAGGAAIGAVGGAIGGNTGKGAAIGAATGGLFGAMRKADQQARSQQQQQQGQAAQPAAAAQGSSAYNRALGACLQGRGYTVQ